MRRLHARSIWVGIAFAIAFAACGDSDEPSERIVLPGPDEPFPEQLSAFRIFPNAPDRTVVASNATLYAPRWPLWSSGSEKERVLVLPDGADADVDEIEGADVPPGSIFFKTFSYEDDGSEPFGRAIETRLLRRTEDAWEYAVYRWDDDGADARLLDITTPTPVAVSDEGESFEHVIPSNRQCRTCHEASPSAVLGYNALQLGREELPAPEGSATAEVMGYVVGNCTHCHNGSETETSSFDLRPDVFLEATIGVPTEGSASGTGIRVVPGEPEESAIVIALAGGAGDIRAMPPVGVQRIDVEAVDLVSAWIDDLEDDDDDDD